MDFESIIAFYSMQSALQRPLWKKPYKTVLSACNIKLNWIAVLYLKKLFSKLVNLQSHLAIESWLYLQYFRVRAYLDCVQVIVYVHH